MTDKHELYRIPYSDSGSLSDAVLEYPTPSGDLTLRFSYERDGQWYAGALHFQRVRGFRFCAEAHATPWHVKGAFDMLAEVRESSWVQEFARAGASNPSATWVFRHYLIFVSSMGAYEFMADSWESLEAPME